jgi:hypothetical protein
VALCGLVFRLQQLIPAYDRDIKDHLTCDSVQQLSIKHNGKLEQQSQLVIRLLYPDFVGHLHFCNAKDNFA